MDVVRRNFPNKDRNLDQSETLFFKTLKCPTNLGVELKDKILVIVCIENMFTVCPVQVTELNNKIYLNLPL